MPPRDPNDDDHDKLDDERDEVQPDDLALIREPADEDHRDHQGRQLRAKTKTQYPITRSGGASAAVTI